MGGPIVRSGASPTFSENWDKIFGGKKKGAAPAKSTKKKPAATKKAVSQKAAPKKSAKKKSK